MSGQSMNSYATESGANDSTLSCSVTNEEDVVLNWAHGAADNGYEVWWNGSPYFLPGDPGTDYAAMPEPPYRDAGAIGTTRYYVVLGMDEADQNMCRSNQVGTFSFSLTPGTTL
jgi:hypothetical protein